MKTLPETFTRYLPVDAPSAQWGWQLVDAGRQHIPSGAPYPGKGHPSGYLFDPTGRRILSEFQIVFITSGRGTFESRSHGRSKIESGEAMVLFPGEWHRYQPATETGWNEYWLGFKGTDATRVMAHFFSPHQPIRRSSHTDELIRLFDQMLHWIAYPIPGGEQIAASFVPMILAFLRTEMQHPNQRGAHDCALVLEAKMHLLENLSVRTDLETLAASLGTSYSRLRAVFKKETGFAPREFENMVKLNRARDLLLSGQYNVSRTAEELGYSSVYYFSRAFRKAFGVSPQNWLAEHLRKISE